MDKYQRPLPDLFHALADPTRLAVIEQLCGGPQPVSVLAKPHRMALPSFMKHLQVLERTGLTSSRKEGRTRIVTLEPSRMAEAEQWVAARRRIWNARFDALDAHLASKKGGPA